MEERMSDEIPFHVVKKGGCEMDDKERELVERGVKALETIAKVLSTWDYGGVLLHQARR